MRIRITVGDGRCTQHLEITTTGQVRWSQVMPALPGPWSTVSDWYAVSRLGAEAVPLGGDEVVGAPPLLHGAELRTRPPPREDAPAALAAVQVAEGPDCGASVQLHPGRRLTVGRDPMCDLTITDPALSRHHLTVWSARGGVVVEDASSTNGSLLEGRPLGQPVVWRPGSRVRIGATCLALDPLVREPVPVMPDGEGGLTLTPRPGRAPVTTDVEIALPSRPDPLEPPTVPVLSWVIPLLVSGALALVLEMPMLLLFGLMAPALTLGTYLSERRRHRRDRDRAWQRYTEQTQETRDRARRAIAAERAVRRSRTPDLAQLRAQVSGPPTVRLWTGDPETLLVRVGTADQPSRVSLAGSPLPVPDAPIEVDLRGGLGILGAPSRARALARSVLVQLLVQHSPAQLRLQVVGDVDPPAWEWLAWAPHRAVSEPGGEDVHHVVLRDQTTDSSAGTSVAAPAATCPVVVAARPEQLPAVDTIATVGTAGTVRVQRTDGRVVTGRPDLLGVDLAAGVARALAPLRPQREERAAGIPGEVHFRQVDPARTSAALAERWRVRPRSTTFALGVGVAGRCELDLVVDGPHALVGGTTGSGKSELLRTMVTGLALANRPDELVFVLVDYKGGAAFAEAALLPHTVGLITDLDPHLADRALTSLTAELKRRERLLGEAGARDLADYQQPGRPPLARLVLVIDEFRALAEELPSFLDGLVRIAALGRSLGVHLVLATQRPGGIVSADVRANVNLRIALRVRDSADSLDVIDSPEAANLPERLPGRALVRTGAGAPRQVQVARVSDVVDTDAPRAASVRVRVLHSLWEDLTEEAADPVPDVADGPSLLARLSDAAQAAATRLECRPPPSPWLEPLPEVVPLADLEAMAPPAAAPAGAAVAFALVDLPHRQRQVTHRWDPVQDGHLGVVGGPRSGRSTLVRTLVAGLTEQAGPGALHLYGFDPSGTMPSAGDLPHTGAWVGAGEVPRGIRVLEVLADLLARRQRELAAAGFTSLTEQHRAAARQLPVVCVVVDGWSRFLEDYGEVHRGRAMELVTQVLREGPAAGVVTLVTGDRTLLTARVAPLFTQLWAMRMSDPNDLLMAGLNRRQVPERMPPGRMVRIPDGVLAQVAVVGTDHAGAAQVRELDALVERVRASAADAGGPGVDPPPAVVRPLPRRVGLSRCAASSDTGLAVGVGGDEATTVQLPVDLAAGGAAVVAGPPGSGRTTTLRTLARSARAAGRTHLLVEAVRGLQSPSEVCTEVEGLPPGAVVLVDDATALAGTPVEDALLAWSRGLSTSGGLLVVSGEPEELSGSFRGLVPIATRARLGILLQPTGPADGSVLGISPVPSPPGLPGRGVLVSRGRITALQVALPE